MTTIRPVILSGGQGTRLWPLSTSEHPKQFVELLPGGEALFTATLRRLEGMDGVGDPVIITGADHEALVDSVAKMAGVGPSILIIEPIGRNTAPASFAAALVLDPDEVMVILPSDHLISDETRFRSHVAEAVASARAGHILTFGITPTRADTGYGYIQMGEAVGAARQVKRFREKPQAEEAQLMLAGGEHVWNSGMFVVTAGTLLEEAQKHCPAILEGVRAASPPPRRGRVALGESFAYVEALSLDHAVMERTERSLVIPMTVGWSDIGSYEALWAVSETDEMGNAAHGRVLLDEVANSYVRATTRLVAVSGVDRIVVVETPEAVLVVSMEGSQRVRNIAARAASA